MEEERKKRKRRETKDMFLKDGNWWLDFYAYGKRKRKKIGPSKKLAELALKKIKVEIAENKFLDVQKNEKIKFEDVADTYLDTYSKPNKRSWKRDELSIKYLKSFFGSRYIHEVNPLEIEKYKRERKERVSPATVNREIACLKHIFTKAVEWRKIKENPASKVKLFKEDNKRLRYLEKEEIAKLINACPDYLNLIVTVALLTGMRKGEILNLKWRDINFSQKIITLLDTKNAEKREVRMNDIVYTTLLGAKKHQDSSYVFCNKDGRPYKDIKKSFHTALKKAEIEDFRFHDLRHTFASQLVMAGINLPVVQRLLGHKSIQMTQRYAHLSPSYEKAAVDHFCEQMDTIWTPKGISENSEKRQGSDKLDAARLLASGPSRVRTYDRRIMSPLLCH